MSSRQFFEYEEKLERHFRHQCQNVLFAVVQKFINFAINVEVEILVRIFY